MKQLTVRGFDKDLERRLRDVAKRRGVSLNLADVVGDSMDDLIGSWSKAEESEFLQRWVGSRRSTRPSGDEDSAWDDEVALSRA